MVGVYRVSEWTRWKEIIPDSVIKATLIQLRIGQRCVYVLMVRFHLGTKPWPAAVLYLSHFHDQKGLAKPV